MIDLKRFHACFRDAGVRFMTGVPDTLLNDFCLFAAAELPPERHVIAANEGNAIAIAAGYYVATGEIPLVYMQNSGLGNTVNPLLSLTHADVYSIPLVLVIGWRGDPAIRDHAHHKKQGQATPVLLEAMDIPYKVLEEDDETARAAARWAVDTARESSTPTALLVRKGVLAKREKKIAEPETDSYEMSREDAIACVLQAVPDDTLCVATTGRATRELYAQRDLNDDGHDKDFLNVGAMGHASSIATGIALGEPRRLVVCFDGDAAAIMHLGSLTTAGSLGLPNFLHVVLNNGAHESVGGQPSAAYKADLTAIAQNAGYETIGKAVETEGELAAALAALLPKRGPVFVDARIHKGIRSDLPLLRVSHVDTKERLMRLIEERRSK